MQTVALSLLLLISAILPSAQAIGKMEKCIVSKCFRKMASCVFDRDCRQFLKCSGKCNPDDEPCTSGCFFKYGNEKVSTLSKCLMEKNCVELKLSELQCPAIVPASIEKFDVRTLAKYGRLFVARGSNDLYDGLPCQYLTFNQLPTVKVSSSLLFPTLLTYYKGPDYMVSDN